MGGKQAGVGGGLREEVSSDGSVLAMAVKWRARPAAESEHRKGGVVLRRAENV